MPNLCRFKQINGKMYCWDKEKKDFFQVKLTPVTDKPEHDRVLCAYMDDSDPDQAKN